LQAIQLTGYCQLDGCGRGRSTTRIKDRNMTPAISVTADATDTVSVRHASILWRME
jgi:hypothetical protein